MVGQRLVVIFKSSTDPYPNGAPHLLIQGEANAALSIRDTASDSAVESGGTILAPDSNTVVSADGLLSVCQSPPPSKSKTRSAMAE